MFIMSLKLALQLAATAGALTVVAEAGSAQIPLQDKPGHVTEATVILDATPAEIYALVTDYANWTDHLTDVRAVHVESPGREGARVRFRSTALQHEVTVQFANEPNRLIKFEGIKGPPGARAHGTYTLEPIDNGTRTKVVASLYIDVVGAPGMFVSDNKTKRMRHDKLQADLSDTMQAFPKRSQPTAAPQAAIP
jgi:ribosome-associated toxin RatA of RatAB toxin-antitoxin module